MPGLIWVRDLMVGDVMVDRSFRVERFRPLGLSRAATLAWEPQSFWELVGSLGAILESWAAERWSGMRSGGRDRLERGGAELAQDVEGASGELARDRQRRARVSESARLQCEVALMIGTGGASRRQGGLIERPAQVRRALAVQLAHA